MFSVKVTDIKWVTDGEEVDLPSTVHVGVRTNCESCVADEEIEEVISDTLSDEWGWLHDGFTWERTPVPKIIIK